MRRLFDLIAGVSLAADCQFKLRPYEKQQQSRKAVITLPVHKRSLYSMKGPLRSEWQHSTAPIEKTRYSITMRTLGNQWLNKA
jgi:alkylated DNA repair dioxygenase AlkB